MPQIIERVDQKNVVGEIHIAVGSDAIHPSTGGHNYMNMNLEMRHGRFHARGFLPRSTKGIATVGFTIVPQFFSADDLESLGHALMRFAATIREAEVMNKVNLEINVQAPIK